MRATEATRNRAWGYPWLSRSGVELHAHTTSARTPRSNLAAKSAPHQTATSCHPLVAPKPPLRRSASRDSVASAQETWEQTRRRPIQRGLRAPTAVAGATDRQRGLRAPTAVAGAQIVSGGYGRHRSSESHARRHG